jgi:HD superfamily phosphohydrolase
LSVDKDREEVLPSETEVVATLVFALIHDAYHGPFGHSLDRIGDMVLADEGMLRIDKALLLDAVLKAETKQGDIWSLVLRVAKWIRPAEPEKWPMIRLRRVDRPTTDDAYALEVVYFLSLLLQPMELATKAPKQYWLRELVDGICDADRMDYLLRDVYYLRYSSSITKDDVTSITRDVAILERAMLVPEVDQVQLNREVEVYRLHWSIDRKDKVAKLRDLRARLYREVYEVTTKRALDEMLAHAIVWVVRSELSVDRATPTRKEMASVLRKLTAITDDELLHLFYELGTKPDHVVSTMIVHDLVVGRPFKEVWRVPIPSSFLGIASSRMSELTDLFQHEETTMLREIQKASGARFLVPADANFSVKRLLNRLRQKLSNSDDMDERYGECLGLVYAIEALYGRSFSSRELLERMLWQRFLCANDRNPELAATIRKRLCQAYARNEWHCQNKSSDDIMLELANTPLLFLSVPWVPPVQTDPAENKARAELVSWDLQDMVPLFHDKGVPVDNEEDPERHDLEQFYVMSVFMPAVLAEDDMCDLINDLMGSMIYSLAWHQPQKVSDQKFPWWEIEAPSEATTRWFNI